MVLMKEQAKTGGFIQPIIWYFSKSWEAWLHTAYNWVFWFFENCGYESEEPPW